MKINDKFSKSIAFLFFLFSFAIHSQGNLEIDIENLHYSSGQVNVSVLECSEINLGSANSYAVSFDLKMSRQYFEGNTTGINAIDQSGVLKVIHYNYNGEIVSSSTSISRSSWTRDATNTHSIYSKPFNTTLFPVDFPISGGYLVVEYVSSDNNYPYSTCTYPITKPKFSMQSSRSSVSCGTTTPVTFTVENENDSPGSLSYEWVIGSGWLHNGSSAPSTITTSSNILDLVADTFPLGTIEVRPKLDTKYYGPFSKTVSLSEYTSAARIFGATTVCSSRVFKVLDSDADDIITWASSNDNIATITPISLTEATITKVGSGVVTITALLTNGCGQTIPLPKAVNIGVPSFLGAMSGDDNPVAGAESWYSVPAATGATSYSWHFDVGGVIGTNVSGWQIVVDQGTSAFIKAGTADAYIVCEAINSCGDREKYMFAAIKSGGSGGSGGGEDPCDEEGLKFGSNPMKSGASTNKVIIIDDPCDDQLPTRMQETKQTISVYNKFGVKVYSKTQTQKEFDVSELKQGFYIVKYETKKGKVISKKLIVQ